MIDWDEICKHGYYGVDDPAPDVPHLIFTYSPGDAIPDHQAEREAALLAGMNIYVSSELVVAAARCLIAEGKLAWNRVVFATDSHYMMTNEYGACNAWPFNLFATGNVLAERTIRAALAKVMTRREEMKRANH